MLNFGPLFPIATPIVSGDICSISAVAPSVRLDLMLPEIMSSRPVSDLICPVSRSTFALTVLATS